MVDRRGRFARHWLLIQELAGDDGEADRVQAAVCELLEELGHLEATVSVSQHAAPDRRWPTLTESDNEFLDRLQSLGEDWRYSDEFIGLVVRRRFPRNYEDLRGSGK